jgi:hypothetical protein
MVLPNENVTGGTMSNDDEMTIDERRKYLRKMQKRYRKASEKERSMLLDEMQKITNLHRKSLIRLINGDLARKQRTKQRGRTYGLEVHRVLKVISESFDYLCAERLQPNLVWMAEHLAAHGELEISSRLIEQLEKVSVSTVRRILKRLGQDQPRLPRKGPEEANRFRRNVPAKRIPWNEQEPGHFEADLVHHCGISASGQYVHTLQMVDVATGWSERVATLGRSYLVIKDGFQRILTRLPFPVVEIHPDNDSAFFNAHLAKFWRNAIKDLEQSRSRAWHKNDNRFVEQKNSTLVRAYLGYVRLDTVDQTILLNQLYDKLWLYYNFFQPVMRLEEKVVVSQENGRRRIRRRYDQARTPFNRLCATGVLASEIQSQLEALRLATNPRDLRREIYELIYKLHDLPCAVEGQTQDVYQTLIASQDTMKGEDIPVTLSNDRTIYAG